MTTEPTIEIHRILVPTDFSPAADEAFLRSVEIAERFDALVDVLHVWAPAPEPTGGTIGEVGAQPPPVVNSIAEDSAKKALDRFLQDHETCSHRVGQTMLVAGRPARAIIDIAEDTGADMVAMGTRGRTGLSRLVMGSTAEKVMRHVSCPVLMVPSDAVPGDTEDATLDA